ncbi:hypothetical protein SLS53_003055 [Cytospora paraplurivora]|uniref:G-patch domain-containing protein n=1 Tax=Cytospora paraplurivora TaxID=2898453 RepID=A0AAN9UFP8_9PEZI
MDASALLKSQGWRGSGHSLHTSDDSIGLAKPILVSRKNNTLGIGRKNHVTSDQWWLNAFDEQLKSLDTSSKTSVVQTKANTKLGGLLTVGAGKYSGANALYACFVSGGLLQGTVKQKDGESTDTTPEAEVIPPVRQESKAERKARREERRRRKAEKAAKKLAKKAASKSKKDKSKTDSKKKSDKKRAVTETKEERRARKETRRKRRAEKEKGPKVEQG